MDWLLEKILLYPRRSITAIAVVLVAAVILVWWFAVWQDPHRVFDDMLSANLQTTSVTRTVTAGNQSQGVDQTVRLEMGSTQASDWLVLARQNGAVVSTESIGTPMAGYIRYTQIAPATTNKQFDASHVTDVWARADGKTDANLSALFSQTLFDITSAPTPPIGNLPDDQRDNILSYMRNEKVFKPDYGKVKPEQIGGRNVYTYSVSVPLAAYARMLQAFAHDLGMNDLDNLDPEQYASLAPVTVEMSVDRVSHQLVKLSYGTSGYVQTYGDWGLLAPITVPAHTITTSELQARLQVLGNSQQ